MTRTEIARIINDGRGPAGTESFGGGHSLAARNWVRALAKADAILALKPAPSDSVMREALIEAWQWIEANTASVRGSSSEAARPGEALLRMIDAALQATDSPTSPQPRCSGVGESV